LIPIGTIALIGLSFLAALAFGSDFMPYFLALALATFVLGFVATAAAGLMAEVIDTLTLARSARRFTQRFPEGSPARPSAIAMLSETETPHKAGQKLLKSLSTPEKRTPASSRQGLQGCVVAALPMVLIVVALALSERGSGETKKLATGAAFGFFFGAMFGRIERPGLKAALSYTLAGPILFGISGIAYIWISRKYGEGWGLYLLAVVLVVRDRVLHYLEKENQSK
jgi:hypothetical protein